MTLEIDRFEDPAAYLRGNLHVRLMEVQREVNVLRKAFVDAKTEEARQAEEARLQCWQDTVAAQDRQVRMETRLQHNITEQTECDLQTFLDERELLMFIIEHP